VAPSADDALSSHAESAMISTDSLHLPTIAVPDEGCPADPPTNGVTISAPSAAPISSSSAEDFTSGMSQSASHPSIPSVVSGASSLSGDGLCLQAKDSDDSSSIPSI